MMHGALSSRNTESCLRNRIAWSEGVQAHLRTAEHRPQLRIRGRIPELHRLRHTKEV